MKSNKKEKKQWMIVPLVLMTIATIWIALSVFKVVGASLTVQDLYHKLVIPIVRLLCYLAGGLLVGQTLEWLGFTARLGRLSRPLTKWGHFKNESGTTLVASFVSGIVANTLLMSFHKEGKISRREMILAYLVNSGVPTFVVHLPTTFFVVLSLARDAGLAYLGINFVAACLRTFGTLLISRLDLPVPSSENDRQVTDVGRVDKIGFAPFLGRLRNSFIRLILYTIPIYALVFLVNQQGLFAWLRVLLTKWVSSGFFPVEAASLIVFSVTAEFTAGFAAAGALLDAGTLTVKQTAVALVAGTVIASPIRAIRHQLPTHTGIFSVGLGSELLFLSQSLRVLSLVLVTMLYWALW